MTFTLPSGRALELHEPTIGEALDLMDGDWQNARLLLSAKIALIVPELTPEEFTALPMQAGLALIKEVGRIWDGRRPEDQEAPFANGSNSHSTDSSLSEQTSPLG